MTTSSHITDNNNDGDTDVCDADVVDNTNTAGKTSITTSSDAICSGCSSVEADGSDETSSDDDVINDLDQLDIICTIGTGTFGRVYLVKSKCTVRSRYYALKAMRIHSVVTTKQVEHVYSEKRILTQLIEHPFVVRLYGTFIDRACLYMRFEFAPGGELFSYLRAAGRFGNRMSRFYAAEIICAIEYMHARHIVYRDLKPENIMLDREGHVKITDFGFAKVVNDRTWTLCGTPEYLAPEVISNKGHSRAVDFWALGILVYEMHAGFTPWHGNNVLEVYDKILDAKLKFPKSFNLIARDFCRKLLQTDRTLRLGCMKNGIADVKSHKWFIAEVDWDDVFARKLIPPLVPTLYHDGDTGNFDSYDEESTTSYDAASPAERDLFADW